MPQESVTDVLIVGAGPTGLMLACQLARRGVAFRIVEASPGPQPGSRGKGLQPRSLEMFDDLGIADRILAHGRMGMPAVLNLPDGTVKPTGEVPAELLDRPDIPYPASLIIPEWRIEETLRARLADFGGEVEFGTTLVSFEQTGEHVTAVVGKAAPRKEGRGPVEETIAARWLVGCDGGHSAVRKRTGIAFTGETREDVRMVVADAEVDGVDRAVWHMWPGPDGMAALCPLPSTGLFQFQATVVPGQDTALTRANLQAILEQRTGRTDIRLHEPVWSTLWRANIRLADRYRDGRVFLAGDAAHVHSPAGGQGMNTGIQDAANLGWKLAAAAGGTASPSLLDTYEAERRPVAEGVLALSNARLAQLTDKKGIPTRRDASTIQLGITYRGSSLSHDDRDETADLRAGDRAPDATGLLTSEGVRRLFDLTRGGRFTLLSFGPDVRVPGATTVRIGPGGIADTEGNLTKTYGATGRTLVLIRPDGYLGVISDRGDAGAVRDYLAALG